MKYGEILFLGKCNCSCFYCLQNEMKRLQQEQENQMAIPFSDWNNFNFFLNKAKAEGIEKIYLSSVTTEPMLYRYLKELILFLKSKGFKVGIRTNGYFALEKMNCIGLLDEEISFSMNALNDGTCFRICHQKNPDWNKIFQTLSSLKKKCRVSIVVNRYNKNEIQDMILFLKQFDCISYVQLRKVYKYYEEDMEDSAAFYEVANFIKSNYSKISNYFESDVYNVNGLQVALWEDVFKKSSIESINYFTNGDISTHNLLIPAYETKEGCINE